MTVRAVLSHYQATQLLKAREKQEETVLTTLSLNLTPTEVTLTAEGVILKRPNHTDLVGARIYSRARERLLRNR